MIDTLIEDTSWSDIQLGSIAEKAELAVFERLDLKGDFETTLLACSDARIAELNAQFRGKQAATNVLSWPFSELASATPGGPPVHPTADELGDIAIAFQTCAAEAKAQKKGFEEHVTHLIVHGILHLLGYDHENDADAERMEQLEREILGKMGWPDPYKDRD